MRFYIIFGVTFILALLICFYQPNTKYLATYKNDLTIEYDIKEDEYSWHHTKTTLFDIKEENPLKWNLDPKKDGKEKIIFYFSKDDNIENSKYEITYEFEVTNNKIHWLTGEARGLLDFPNPY